MKIDKSNTKRDVEDSIQTNLFSDKIDLSKVSVLRDSAFSPDELFGENDAYMEDLNTLKEYAIERNDCSRFYDAGERFVILSGPKGMGKTTLCKLWKDKLSKLDDRLVVMPLYSETPDTSTASNVSDFVRVWKKKIVTLIGQEILNDPDCPTDYFSDFELRAWPRNRNNLLDILISQIKAHKKHSRDQALISKLEQFKNYKFWVILDEFDYDFTREPKSMKSLLGMLMASREIISEISNIFIRITIKPNVWANLLGDDMITNIRPHKIDLEWSPEEIRSVLAKRVETYLKKNSTEFQKYRWNLGGLSVDERESWLVSQIYDSTNFDLGKGSRPPEIVLSKLCADRPRWVIELSKEAARRRSLNRGLITIKHIKDSFSIIGPQRFNDIGSEYKSRCPKIPTILNCFFGAKPSYSLNYLLGYIQDRIIAQMDVEIVGVAEKCTAAQLADFLYELTFVEPRKNLPQRKHRFLHYKDHPSLIAEEITNPNISKDLYWIIHPAFRNFLSIGEPTNEELNEE